MKQSKNSATSHNRRTLCVICSSAGKGIQVMVCWVLGFSVTLRRGRNLHPIANTYSGVLGSIPSLEQTTHNKEYEIQPTASSKCLRHFSYSRNVR